MYRSNPEVRRVAGAPGPSSIQTWALASPNVVAPSSRPLANAIGPFGPGITASAALGRIPSPARTIRAGSASRFTGRDPICRLETRQPATSPAADRRDDLVRRVLLDVVAGALQEGRPVVREDRLPALPLGFAERDVLRRPDDQRPAIAQSRQRTLDVREEGPA